MEKTPIGAQNNFFDRSMERWTESSTFVHTLARRAFASFQFVHPVAQLIRKNLKEQTDVIDNEKCLRDSSFPSPASSTLPPQSSNDKTYHTHSETKNVEREEILDVAKE